MSTIAPARTQELEWVSCAMCGGTRFRQYRAATPDVQASGERFEVVACTECSLIQTNPRPTRQAIGRFYPSGYGPHQSGAHAPWGPGRRALHTAAVGFRTFSFAPYRLIFRPGERYPKPQPGRDRLLDVGTGAGWYAARMARLGWSVRGIEPDPEAACQAAAAAGVSPDAISVGSAEDAEFPDASFDLITMAHVIEHLHDPVGVLEKARRWIAPGGRLVIWCPNVASFESRLFRRRWFALEVPRHLYHFTPSSIARMLATAGFTTTRIFAEEQSSTFAGSLQRVVRGRPGYPGGVLLHATEPVVGLLLALGDKPSMVVTASPS